MFYGWYIVIAAAIFSTYFAGCVGYGLTAFIGPIAATFGWTYTQISLGVSMRGLEQGVLDPLFGMVVDRWPARRLMVIGFIIIGLGMLCISQATNLVMFYAGFVVLGMGSSLAIHMTLRTTIARWFRKDLGKASGLLAMGVGSGGLWVPLIVIMIDTYGWQNSLAILAVGMWIVGIPLSLLFRTSPQEYRLLPDGKPKADLKPASSVESHDLAIASKGALKSRVFWQLGSAFLLTVAARTGLMTHIMPYLDSMGVERSTAAMIVMIISLAGLPARIGFGWLADIFPKKHVAAVSMLIMSTGVYVFWLIDGSSLPVMITFAVIFGLGVGGTAPLTVPLVRYYFGTKSFGSILGMITIFNMIGLIVSPPLAGWVYDTLGVYDPVWLALSCSTTIGAILFATLPRALIIKF